MAVDTGRRLGLATSKGSEAVGYWQWRRCYVVWSASCTAGLGPPLQLHNTAAEQHNPVKTQY